MAGLAKLPRRLGELVDVESAMVAPVGQLDLWWLADVSASASAAVSPVTLPSVVESKLTLRPLPHVLEGHEEAFYW